MSELRTPLNIAVIGAGRMGRIYAGIVSQMTPTRLVAVCGHGAERARSLAASFDIPAYVDGRHDQMLEAHPEIDAVITTGGTGVTGRDVTPEAFQAVFDKEVPGFGELFRWISFAKIKTSAIQSRAIAGVAGGTYLFAIPGSPGACKDAWDEILVYQLDSRSRPCNFVELMPRLNEQ